ncbi:Putative phage holin [Pseudomonas flavescens]|uniref:Putative phage holin n=1 Tax=Phytopseudomonas flavescens TaxID=29435 RepID=A0A1G8NAB6_9GAMM|nr:putative holin [Pseudomonas flavescens]SDI77194.1 Putative phage holin [Pseudomonas flavescens]
MSEPVSVLIAGTLGVDLPTMLNGINGEAAVGALFGALVYFTTTHELPLWNRLAFFLTSFVMGYLFTPAIVDFELYGMRPFAYSGPAGFAGAGLVVTIMLAAIKRRGAPPGVGTRGGNDD